MTISTPYPPSLEDRHPIQCMVSRPDWEDFQRMTGQRRGLCANLLATYFHAITTELRSFNLPTYDHDATTDTTIRDIIQRVSVRITNGSGCVDDE